MADGIAAPPRAFADFDDSEPSNAGYFPPYSVWPPSAGRYFPPVVGDPAWCIGHVDTSATRSHHTHWERFGPDGVVVTQDEGQPALVSTADVVTDRPRTAEQALLLAFQIQQAALFAMRQPIAAPPFGAVAVA